MVYFLIKYKKLMRYGLVYVGIFFGLGFGMQAIKPKTYDKQGHLVAVNRVNWQGKPEGDANGVWRVRLEYENDRLVKTMNTDQEGKIIQSRLIPGYIVYKYDKTGHLVERLHMDFRDKMSDVGTQAAQIRYTYENGKPTAEQYFKANNEAYSSGELGLHQIRYQYNFEGKLVGKILLDKTGNLCKNDNVIEKYTYNQLDQLNKIGYFADDKDKTPNNYALFQFNSLGQTTKKSVYGANNDLQKVTDFKYDDDKHMTSKTEIDYEAKFSYTFRHETMLDNPNWTWQTPPNLSDLHTRDAVVTFEVEVDARGNLTKVVPLENDSDNQTTIYECYWALYQAKIQVLEGEQSKKGMITFTLLADKAE